MKQSEVSCGTDESKKKVRMVEIGAPSSLIGRVCNLEMSTSLLCFLLLAYLRMVVVVLWGVRTAMSDMCLPGDMCH